MLNLQLRDEFKSERLRGTTIDFSADRPTSALQKSSAEFIGAWPYSPVLMHLLEDQVLIATEAQETRDLIRILVDLFKTRGEKSSGNIYFNRDLIVYARAVYLANQWKETDPAYRPLRSRGLRFAG